MENLFKKHPIHHTTHGLITSMDRNHCPKPRVCHMYPLLKMCFPQAFQLFPLFLLVNVRSEAMRGLRQPSKAHKECSTVSDFSVCTKETKERKKKKNTLYLHGFFLEKRDKKIEEKFTDCGERKQKEERKKSLFFSYEREGKHYKTGGILFVCLDTNQCMMETAN